MSNVPVGSFADPHPVRCAHGPPPLASLQGEGGVAAGGAPDGELVYLNDFVDALKALERIVRDPGVAAGIRIVAMV